MRSPETTHLPFLAFAVRILPMDTSCMERVLAGIRPDEVRDFQNMLALWERAGWIDQEEAAEWRRRILGAQTVPSPAA